MTGVEVESLSFAGQQVWTAARDLVTRHGGDAPLYARATLALSIERGDFGNARQWRLVWRATEALLADAPTSPHGRH